jgi:fatty acid desaturase
MRTRLTIMAIVLAAVTAAIGTIVMLTLLLGWLGLAIGLLGALAVLVAYRLFVQPWQHRWGAADQEVHRSMPGDDLIPDAASPAPTASSLSCNSSRWATRS